MVAEGKGQQPTGRVVCILEQRHKVCMCHEFGMEERKVHVCTPHIHNTSFLLTVICPAPFLLSLLLHLPTLTHAHVG